MKMMKKLSRCVSNESFWQQRIHYNVHHTQDWIGGLEDSLYCRLNNRLELPWRPHCSVWPEKHSQNGAQILVAQKISLCFSARGSKDKQNQQAPFDRRKASLNRAWQNTSSAAADSCLCFCRCKMEIEWNYFRCTKLVLKHQQHIYCQDQSGIMWEQNGAVNKESCFCSLMVDYINNLLPILLLFLFGDCLFPFSLHWGICSSSSVWMCWPAGTG